MKKKWIASGVVLAAIASVITWLVTRDSEPLEYRFVEVTRGDIESTVSASGRLSAVSAVQVGTQVSGQVAEILADFNDRVRKGQVIARIDPTLAQQAVREAEASLDRARSDADMKAFTFRQVEDLYRANVIAESDYRAAEFNLTSSRASLASAEASLERAQRNLEYTVIRAPISGIVVERNVEVGQTVASSLSTPQLFLIAEDLSRMQILASVDESDIGQIREGLPVRFTVQAYPDRTFTGSVRQVRLQSKTTENVVTYTVVIEVANPDGKLLPGMTATVDVQIAAVQNVLAVPNAALRFRATDEMRAQLAADSAEGMSRGGRSGGRAGGGPFAILWHVNADGKLSQTRVRTGLTDGQNTEVEGPGLTEGLRVIAGTIQASEPTSTAANPFQSASGGRGGGGPGGPGGPPGPPGGP